MQLLDRQVAVSESRNPNHNHLHHKTKVLETGVATDETSARAGRYKAEGIDLGADRQRAITG